MARKVNVIEDLNGMKTVFIHDILFKGKRAIPVIPVWHSLLLSHLLLSKSEYYLSAYTHLEDPIQY